MPSSSERSASTNATGEVFTASMPARSAGPAGSTSARITPRLRARDRPLAITGVMCIHRFLRDVRGHLFATAGRHPGPYLLGLRTQSFVSSGLRHNEPRSVPRYLLCSVDSAPRQGHACVSGAAAARTTWIPFLANRNHGRCSALSCGVFALTKIPLLPAAISICEWLVLLSNLATGFDWPSSADFELHHLTMSLQARQPS